MSDQACMFLILASLERGGGLETGHLKCLQTFTSPYPPKLSFHCSQPTWAQKLDFAEINPSLP